RPEAGWPDLRAPRIVQMSPTPQGSMPGRAGGNGARALGRRPRTPSLLDIIRLSPDPIFPPGGEPLYRQIALLTELGPDKEVLDTACGRGLTTIYLAANYGVDAVGLDADDALVSEAEQRARVAGLEDRVHFQSTPLNELPFQDGVFDLAIGEIGLGALVDPATAIRELARVTRPLGSVVLVQLVWTGNVNEAHRELLVEHLGARPLLLIEWKQLLREAGCVDLHVEDWSDQSGPFRPSPVRPLHDLARLFSFRQKVA